MKKYSAPLSKSTESKTHTPHHPPKKEQMSAEIRNSISDVKADLFNRLEETLRDYLDLNPNSISTAL